MLEDVGGEHNVVGPVLDVVELRAVPLQRSAERACTLFRGVGLAIPPPLLVRCAARQRGWNTPAVRSTPPSRRGAPRYQHRPFGRTDRSLELAHLQDLRKSRGWRALYEV